ncbi:MAG: Smr/MutS family protein [Chloroflexi bacterium]|nr:Smr/MutS family protein [Chloroflexota bacterium]MBP8059048.1 Smr/MutS family protein [Chloroflexota bacterium]
MDNKSFRILEFDKVLDRVAGYTSFSGGEALARELRPTTDLETAQRWQAETQEAVTLLDTRDDITIGGARDVRRAISNAERGFTLQPADFLDIRGTVIAARNLRRILIRLPDHVPHLAAIAELIEECPGVVAAISETLDDKGEVLDSASPKLAKIRHELRVAYNRLHEKLQRLVNSSQSQFLQEPIITQRGGRYVIPLKAEYKGRIAGVVHDQSGSGATLWVEPLATVELNNEYRSLQVQEEDEVQRVLRELSGKIAIQAEALIRVVERVAELDLILARARYAIVTNSVAPQFVPWRPVETPRPPKHTNAQPDWQPPARNPHPGSTVWIRRARHPLLDTHTVVPTDLTLDENTFLVLITGPNTGGKTVSLKTMGLMTLMAQAGLHVPATEARLTVFNNVFADIGDEQSIEQSLSTFSAHITNIIRILTEVDDRSLVLLDELGSGTDPAEGAAIAEAIVNYLRDKGATTFIATHYPQLKVYANDTVGATNASLLFDMETLRPTYQMTIGIPGRSNAIAIARRLGLDETILHEAMKLLGSGNNRAEDMLEQVYELREKIEAQEAAARLQLRRLDEDREVLSGRLEQIEEERQRLLMEARHQAQAELEELREEIRQMRKKIRDTSSVNALKQVTQEVERIETQQVALVEPPKEKARSVRKARETLAEGDTVMVKALGTQGQIISLGKSDALVALGNMTMRVDVRGLVLKEAVEDKEAQRMENVPAHQVAAPGMDLDLRGKRVEEGLEILERHLDAAAINHLPWLTIIHGKGTGKLRQAVRKMLKEHPNVSSWEEGRDGEGGDGVTVAKFQDG